MGTVDRSVRIEDLIRAHPAAIRFMVENGLPCYVCGEPVWGTFEDIARREGRSEIEIDRLIEDLRQKLRQTDQ